MQTYFQCEITEGCDMNANVAMHAMMDKTIEHRDHHMALRKLFCSWTNAISSRYKVSCVSRR